MPAPQLISSSAPLVIATGVKGDPGPKGDAGDDGAAGPVGPSNYQRAVALGQWVGTEEAYLASLQGAPGSPSTDVEVEVPDGTVDGYSIHNAGTGLQSGATLGDTAGWRFGRSIETELFGRELEPVEASLLVVGEPALHRGAILRLGRTPATPVSYSLQSVTLACPNGNPMRFAVEACESPVTLNPGAGNVLNGGSAGITITPGNRVLLVCTPNAEWRSHRFLEGDLTATAVAVPITEATLRNVDPIEGAVYWLPTWPPGRGSRWVPNANGLLEPEGGVLPLYRGFGYYEPASLTGEQVTDMCRLVAGALQPGWRLRTRYGVTKSAQVDTVQPRIRLGASDTAIGSNTELGNSTAMSTGNRSLPYEFDFAVVDATHVLRGPGPTGTGGLGGNTNAYPGLIELDDSVDTELFLSFSLHRTVGTTETFGRVWCTADLLV